MNGEIKAENGVSESRLAMSLMRTFCIVLRGMTVQKHDRDVLEALQLSDGWRNVAVIAMSKYFASTDENKVLTVKQLAEELRVAFYRGLTGDDPRTPFASAPVREQLGWECVARHAAWLPQADEEMLGRLDDVELGYGNRLEKYARDRGVTLEHQSTSSGGKESAA